MIQFLFWSTLILGLFYFFLILWIVKQWPSKIEHGLPKHQTHNFTRFSIIIPVRNGEKKLNRVLKSVLNQNYPKEAFEIIVIDDHSSDATFEIAQNNENVKVLQLKGQADRSNKKLAISQGVANSSHEYIITTDVDCQWTGDLLAVLDQKIKNKTSDIICGPVQIDIEEKANYRSKFEQMDMAGMMLVTNAGIAQAQYYLANGAFLSYKKTDFERINPYADNWDVASGDDVFLMDKMIANGMKADFLIRKEARVYTESNDSWQDFMAQRKRWSGKNRNIGNYRLKAVMGLSYLFNISLLLATVILLFGQLYFHILLLWGVKIITDLLMYGRARSFFDLSIPFWEIPLLSVMHTLYISIFGSYSLLGSSSSDQWR